MLDGISNEAISVDAEQALLGAILLENKLIDDVSGIVTAGDFADPIHAHVFARALALHADNAKVTPLTLKPHVAGLDNIGGVPVWSYLGRLAANTPTLAGALDYAQSVRALAVRRKLHAVGIDLIAASSNHEVPLVEIAAQTMGAIDEVMASVHAGARKSISFGDAMRDTLDAILNDDRSDVFTTGFADLDRRLGGGWRKKQFNILAGRPSMGKTATAISSMLQSARAGNGVFFLSMEMPFKPIMERAITDLAYSSKRRLTYSALNGGKLNQADWAAVHEATIEYKSLPMRIDDSSALTVAEIGSRIRAEQKIFAGLGAPLSLVFIDHLEYVKSSDRYKGSKVNEVTEKSAALKMLAKDLDIAVVLLCQLNRGTEGRENKRPSLSDLRDSGALEQDADVVVFPYREAYYLERTKHDAGSQAELKRQTELDAAKNLLELIVAKCRQGEPGTVPLFCDMGSNAIRNLG